MYITLLRPYEYSYLFHSLSDNKLENTEDSEIIKVLYLSHLANHAACAEKGLANDLPVCWTQFRSILSGSNEHYRTSVQLYKSLRFLIGQIDEKSAFLASGEAIEVLRYWACCLNKRFFDTHGSRLDGFQTAYRLCHWGMIPQENEPEKSLLRDLPDAYARLRNEYLREFKPDKRNALIESNKLFSHLNRVNEHALIVRTTLENFSMEMPNAYGESPEAVYHSYRLREKIDESVQKNVVYNDHLWF